MPPILIPTLAVVTIEMHLHDSEGDPVTTNTWCIGATPASALAKWRKKHPKLAQHFYSAEVETPKGAEFS